jgi:hypothetical protein
MTFYLYFVSIEITRQIHPITIKSLYIYCVKYNYPQNLIIYHLFLEI